MKWFTQVFPISLIISFLIHMGVIGVFHFQNSSELKDTNKNVEIEYITTSPKTEQIVEQDKRLNKKVPTKDSLLGKFDQSVDEQMRANKSGETKDTAGGGQFLPKQTVKLKPKGNKKTSWEELSLTDLKPKFEWAPEEQKNQAAFVGQEAQSNDFIDKIKRGNQNLLSTREFKYYTYFSRIRKQLQEYWEPSLRSRLHKLLRSGRHIASLGPKTTKILITLNNEGNLIGVQVLEDSGVRVLDEAAIDAFREAAPFPNPPNGIIEKDGTVKIRWDFVLEA